MVESFTKKDAKEFKEDIKKVVEENRKELQRYIGIISEDFQHKLNLVIDGQSDIKREVGELKADVNVLKKDVNELKRDVNELKTKTDKIHIEIISHRDNTEVHAQKAKAKKRA